jgi:hypothetical protein
MRRITLRLLLGTLAGVLATPLTGSADQLFHSVRLPFVLTTEGAIENPPLRSGHVIDIHPNGPVYGAHERYVVNGAKPNHSYDVVLRIFADDADDCQGTPVEGFDPLYTVTLETNRNGVAHGKFDFPAGNPLEESLFVWVYWTLVEHVDGIDIVAYQTDCILVGVDSL